MDRDTSVKMQLDDNNLKSKREQQGFRTKSSPPENATDRQTIQTGSNRSGWPI